MPYDVFKHVGGMIDLVESNHIVFSLKIK